MKLKSDLPPHSEFTGPGLNIPPQQSDYLLVFVVVSTVGPKIKNGSLDD